MNANIANRTATRARSNTDRPYKCPATIKGTLEYIELEAEKGNFEVYFETLSKSDYSYTKYELEILGFEVKNNTPPLCKPDDKFRYMKVSWENV